MYLHTWVICRLFTYFKYCSHQSAYIVHSCFKFYYRNSFNTFQTLQFQYFTSVEGNYCLVSPVMCLDASCVRKYILQRNSTIFRTSNFGTKKIKEKSMGCSNDEVNSFMCSFMLGMTSFLRCTTVQCKVVGWFCSSWNILWRFKKVWEHLTCYIKAGCLLTANDSHLQTKAMTLIFCL